ncbi:hypothetical protein MMC22_011572 [Lobaria immixta]|nr:hypothetical protein [Lobaria immixta]
MQSYTFKEAITRNELDAIVDLVWKAQYNPYDPSFSAFFPVFGPTARDREVAIKNSKDRLWQSHQSEPSSHWIYVEDPLTGEVVGGTEWQLYETNPFVNGPPKMEASWWPEGEGRNFCNEILRQCYAPRHRWLTRPHLALNLMSVHPKHRRRGIGSTLMTWGIGKAQELGIESFIEASASGRFLYERFGYSVLFKIAFDSSKADPSDEWRKLEHELTPIMFYAMWRPARNALEDRKTEMQWDFREKG